MKEGLARSIKQGTGIDDVGTLVLMYTEMPILKGNPQNITLFFIFTPTPYSALIMPIYASIYKQKMGLGRSFFTFLHSVPLRQRDQPPNMYLSTLEGFSPEAPSLHPTAVTIYIRTNLPYKLQDLRYILSKHPVSREK
jgi:hypothetical protein